MFGKVRGVLNAVESVVKSRSFEIDELVRTRCLSDVASARVHLRLQVLNHSVEPREWWTFAVPRHFLNSN